MMSATRLYPLRFQPIYRNYPWGGRRLETVLGKNLGAGEHFAESWEIVDRGEDQSRVACGPLQGTPLGELVRSRGAELLGQHHPQSRFPLLFKFLDAQRSLSVQVHPDDEQAARLDPPDLGKTEAWVVLHAEPGSAIYAGLKRGFDRAALEREVSRGTTELCLHRFESAPGDCVYIPAGTVHALGAGLLVAELQQASDTTFRLFDWNRVGADGKPRPLHVPEALATINYAQGPVTPQTPQPTGDPGRERLVECEKFLLDRWRLRGSVSLGGDDRFHIVAAIEGEAMIEGDAAGRTLRRGETILLPACCEAVATADDECVLLDASLP
jgi:mannose-6-phosphate isomerase